MWKKNKHLVNQGKEGKDREGNGRKKNILDESSKHNKST
jgi:hypothetical protein